MSDVVDEHNNAGIATDHDLDLKILLDECFPSVPCILKALSAPGAAESRYSSLYIDARVLSAAP